MTTARSNNDLDFATPERLERLLSLVNDQKRSTRHPAQTVNIEVDGEVVGDIQPSNTPESMVLPNWSRSLTLRDEDGAARAHLFVQEGEMDRVSYDQGRILLSLEWLKDGTSRLTIEQASIRVP